METPSPPPGQWLSRPTLYPERAKWLRRLDAVAQVVGMAAVVIGSGIRQSMFPSWEFGALAMTAMAVITVGIGLRYRWSLKQRTFVFRYPWTVVAAVVWVVGMLVVTIFGPLLPEREGIWGPRWCGYVALTEIVLAVYSLSGLVRGLRAVASGGINPAFLLVVSFLVLISLGTILLMLPVCRAVPPGAPSASAPFLTALFTATSAGCVTGLVVEPTGTYWSRVGQMVILLLIQTGGLGIMTFGAFFAALAGKNIRLAEFATIRDLFASEGLGDVRRMIFAILGFTFLSELVGALLLWPLWPELTPPTRLFYCLFHATSAFCNAGFSLTENNLVGMADCWQIYTVIPLLIILGGLGFLVMYNVQEVLLSRLRQGLQSSAFRIPQHRTRLRLTSKLVLVTTAGLLLFGWVGLYFLERAAPGQEPEISLADAWFQSVTLRTAGFNTVEIGELHPASRLLGILLMAIGVSPGSTGGGMKVTVFAIAIVGLLSILRGRDRVEVFDRTISSTQVNRAFTVVLVMLAMIMTASLLLVIFEGRPELFLEHLFEVTSAVGTVGLSSQVSLADGSSISVTQSLTTASRMVLVVIMFLGRIGPLTLLLALAGDPPTVRYEYPVERVILG